MVGGVLTWHARRVMLGRGRPKMSLAASSAAAGGGGWTRVDSSHSAAAATALSSASLDSQPLTYVAHKWTASPGSPFAAHLRVALLAPADCAVSVRGLRTTAAAADPPSSKVEETVERLKKKQRQQDLEPRLQRQLDDLARVEDLKREVRTVMEKDRKEHDEKKKKEANALTEKKSLWVRFVDEVKHYYSGFKLLYLDVKICSKIIWKVCKGNTLTRRENRQLVRTTSDLFRLVPFSVFVIVPFMELLLPVALKLFPGMLPSTFATKDERETKMRRTLKAKLEYAKFLQATLDEMAPSSSNERSSQSAKAFVTFYRKVKEEGVLPTNEDIVKFSQLFEDEITLDNMNRSQLVALCRILELTPMGTNNFLRFQLEMKVRQLKIDDKVIQREGLDNLDVTELQAACKERGMRAYGMPESTLREQLGHWLDLSLNNSIPTSLLLLSRTLYLPENFDVTSQIAATISSLPESAATQTSAQIGEREGKIRNVMRLQLIQDEQRKIEEEEAEMRELEEAERQKEQKEKERAQEEAEAKERESVKQAVKQMDVPKLKTLVTEARDQLKARVEEAGEGKEGEIASVDREEISTEDLEYIRNAIDSLRKADSDRDDLDELKKEMRDYEQDLEELAFVKALAGRPDLGESKGARRLFSKVNRMLGKTERLVEALQTKERKLTERLQEKGAEITDEEKEKEHKNLVSVHELIAAVNHLQAAPDSSKVEHIASVIEHMDVDSDGVINIDQVTKVIELLGREQVDLSPKQINMLVDMLHKEEMLQMESNIEKILGTSMLSDLQSNKEQDRAAPDSEAPLASTSESKAEEGSGVPLTMSRREEDKDVLQDKAKDLTEQEPEPHIKEMFDSQPSPEQKQQHESNEDKEPARRSMRASAGADNESSDGSNPPAKSAKSNGHKTPPIHLK